MGPCLLALLSAGRTAQARQVPCVMNFGSADLVARVCADVILGKKISCLVRRSARGRLTERHFCAVLQRAVQCCNAPCGVATCRAVLQAITEPWAGSDVSRIRTTAVKSACGKFYIVNGKAQRPRRPFATRAMLSCRCHVSDVRAGTGPTAAMPNMRWDWAHPCHICTGTGPTPAMPHLRRDRARPCRHQEMDYAGNRGRLVRPAQAALWPGTTSTLNPRRQRDTHCASTSAGAPHRTPG